MSATLQLILQTIFIGITATIILDLWAWLLNRLFQLPITNWAMVGRWFGHLPSGQWIQSDLSTVYPIPFELVFGWCIHYLIGIGYVAILLCFEGTGWLIQPTILPALLLSWILLIAPFFIMMPGMGAGIAGAKTVHPTTTRIISILGHSIFGLSMFISAVLFNRLGG